MKLLVSILSILAVQISVTEAINRQKCFFAILCDGKLPIEFRRVMLKADQKLIGHGLLDEIKGIKKATDIPEFWESYPDYKCDYTEEKKKAVLVLWIEELGEYSTEACVDERSEQCVKMGEAEMEYNVITAEYTQKGFCPTDAEDGGKKVAAGMMLKMRR